MKKNNKLKNNTVVGTVMSNMGFDLCLKNENIEVKKTKVGDRYVLEEMRENEFSLGGEQSGHIIFLDYNTTGDGLLTAVQLLTVVRETGKKLSELASVMTTMPQILINSKVNNKKKHDYLKDEDIKNRISEIENYFHGNGRVLIRPSGTEPLVRVMIEGQNEDEIQKYATELADLIETKLS